jgi:hypothetical protein
MELGEAGYLKQRLTPQPGNVLYLHLSEGAENCMSSEHFGQLAWQFKRMSGSSGLKVQAAIAC